MADIDVGGVVAQIKADVTGLQAGLASFEAAMKQMVQSGDATGRAIEKQTQAIVGAMKQQGETAQTSAGQQTAAFAAVAAAALKGYQNIRQAIDDGIAAANEYKNALLGLESVANANGIGDSQMQQALNSVTDEFFDAAAAATSFKNLLARGYSVEQATQTILRLKDAAAFGRQASYSLRDSVVSATEGLKNENSVLVDNAGVTKNVSKMWEDYAKARGLSTAKMTQAQKVEAEYLGIIQETAAQVGDMGKLADSAAGSQAKLANQSTLLAQAFGEAMTPIEQLKTEVLGGLLEGLTGLTEAFPGVTAGATSATAALLGLVVIVKSADAIRSLTASFKLLNLSMGKVALIVAAIGAIVAIITKLKQASEEAAKTEAERVQANKDAVTDQLASIRRLDELEQRYKELSSKQVLSMGEAAELSTLRRELAEAYGIEAGQVRDAAKAHGDLADAIEDERAESYAQLAAVQNRAAWDAINAMNNDPIKEKIAALRELYACYREDPSVFGTATDVESLTHLNDFFRNSGLAYESFADDFRAAKQAILDAGLPDTMENVLEQMMIVLKQEYTPKVQEAMAELLSLKRYENLAAGKDLGTEAFATALLDSMKSAFDPEKFEDTEQGVRNAVNAIMDILQSPKLQAAYETLKSATQQAMEGAIPTADQNEDYALAWYDLFGPSSPLLATFAYFTDTTKEGWEQINLATLAAAFGLDWVSASAQESMGTLRGISASARDAALGVTTFVDTSTKSVEGFTRNLEALGRQKTAITTLKNLSTQLRNAEKGSTAYNRVLADVRKNLNAAGISWDDTTQSVDDLDSAIETTETNMRNFGAAMGSDLQGIIDDAEATRQALINASNGEIDVNTDPAIQALDNLIKVARIALAILVALKLSDGAGDGAGDGSGGGGGGKKNDAEEAARKAEEARKKALADAYAQLEHLKALEQVTYEQELEHLEEIGRKYLMNAEERMAHEEKLYEVKKRIWQRDADSVDTLSNGIIDALTARYEAMRDIELETLEESRKAWQDWADESTAAIQEQIDALDALSQTEDREAKDAEELRKIAKLRQEIEYEQDAYNRAKIEQQLEAALQSRADRLRKLDISDQKTALQEQLEAVQAEADKQISILDEQQTEIEKVYDERLKTAALNAEAEKVLMQSTQQDIIALLNAFAPDYDATGKSLGERFVDGFKSQVGDVTAWMDNMNQQVLAWQSQAAQAAQAASDAFYAGRASSVADTAGVAARAVQNVTVEQSNTFNVPVESPSDTASRVAQANEDLGLALLGL